MAMRLTIDASVANKLLLDEPGSDEARSYLPQQVENGSRIDFFLSAPTLVLMEVHNTLAKKFHKSLIELSKLAYAEPLLLQAITVNEFDLALARRARMMSLVANSWSKDGALPIGQSRKPFNIYDCVYIAHAEKYGTTLLTADKDQAYIARLAFDIPVIFIDVEALKQPN
jgi:predicted nucleic acid-binding protein